jgi:formylglycine-generating enzyme required for sulfatase activity
MSPVHAKMKRVHQFEMFNQPANRRPGIALQRRLCGSILFGVLCLLNFSRTIATEFLDPLEIPEGLSLHWRGSDLVLHYFLSPQDRIATIYQSETLNQSMTQWKPLLTFPIDWGGDGERVLDRSNSSPVQFFRIESTPANLSPNLIWIPPGSFLMGSDDSEKGRYSDEGPPHVVRIEYGFWFNRYEVTVAEYVRLMGENPSKAAGADTLPVERVPWPRAMEYCQKLTDEERAAGRLPPGYVYRLPTEAEWEFACRAGTTTRYYFGDFETDLSQHAWWAANGGPAPHPVGEKLPNPWGIYAMHGNVFEWCLDKYRAYPDGNIRSGPERRVVRSGAFYCPANIVRSACRFESTTPSTASWLIGFRVALAPVAPLLAETNP